MKEFTKYKDRGAYHYKWYRENKFRYRDHVHAVISYITEPGSVLDVGCGDGCISHYIYKTGKSRGILGVDTDKYGIAQAVSHNLESTEEDVRFERCSIYEMGLVHKYDYVVAHDVIEHLVHPETAIKIMSNICNKFCLITTPDVVSADLSAYDYQLWDDEGIKQLFKGYNYEYKKIFDTFFIKLMG